METKVLRSKIEEHYLKAKSISSGHLASYIPELTKVDPSLFSVAIALIDGSVHSFGETKEHFTLQSTSKPFVYSWALEVLGLKKILSHVCVEPTGEPFNSIIELEKSTHRPYNPMINSGAIAIANLMADHYQKEQVLKLEEFLAKVCGQNLTLNPEVFQSERATAHRNFAIAHLLKNFNIIPHDIAEGLDLYFHQCSMQVNVEQLACMAATYARGGVQPQTQQRVLSVDTVTKALSLMLTCGMYDTAGEWAFNVGLPAKSGVSGAMFAVVPGVMGIAAYSPLINKHGHSLRAYNFIESLARDLGLNIFK